MEETRCARLKLSRLTPQHFREYRDARLKEAAPNTVRLDLCLISKLFKVARKEWNLQYLSNPIAEITLPSPGKGRDRRLDEAEAPQFEQELDKCRNEIIRLAMLFAVHTAARQGEILRLKRKDVNLKRRTALLRDTKNGDDRTVALSKDAFEIVDWLLKQHDEERVFPVTRSAITSAWRRIKERAGIEDFSFRTSDTKRLRDCLNGG